MNSTAKQSDITVSPKRPRRRFAQFGISFILLTTLGVASVLGWMSHKHRQSQLQQTVIDTYSPSTVYYDHELNAFRSNPNARNQTIPAPGWWLAKRLYGDHIFSKIAFLTIQYGDMTDVDLLKHLTELRRLRISDCNDLRCLKGISNLANLTTLSIVDCDGLLDVDLFASLPNVETLEVSCSYMQPEFFERLAELGRLRSLTVRCRDEIGDTSEYASLLQIKRLVLSSPGVREIEGLKKMKHLEMLRLDRRITIQQYQELREALPYTQIQAGSLGPLRYLNPIDQPNDGPHPKDLKILDLETLSLSMLQFDETIISRCCPPI